jgi:hypothetical protein
MLPSFAVNPAHIPWRVADQSSKITKSAKVEGFAEALLRSLLLAVLTVVGVLLITCRRCWP